MLVKVLNRYRKGGHTWVDAVCPFCKKVYVTREDHLKRTKYKTKCKSCRSKKANLKHGLSRTKLYRVYLSMVQRCTNKKDVSYSNYGGKGVRVLFDDFVSFKAWSERSGYKQGLSIDRIDNDGDYSPFNCRWVDRVTQNNNTSLINKRNTTGFRCVTYNKKAKRFVCEVRYNGVKHYLGLFDTAEDAARAYDKFAIENKTGKPLNFPNEVSNGSEFT